MRGLFTKSLLCLLAAVLLAGPAAEAAQRTGTRKTKGDRPDKERSYALGDIMKAPKEFLEREVVFYCRYAANANLFKPVNTRFNVNHHVNFAVWPDKAVLWEGEARKNILPTLYIAKNAPDIVDVLRGVKRYELLAVTGMVQNVYAGYPWILVTKLERVEKPSERLSDMVIEHMQSGYDALRADAGGVAARHFEQAVQFGLPCEYLAKAYEQLARAYLLDNKLDRARGYLRQAVQLDNIDPILHLALADVALRMDDAGEAIAHATFALERSGRYPQAYGIKGEAMSLLGDYGKAFADLNTAAGTPGITAREKAMVNIRRARIYTRSDRYPDAARVYAASSEPGEPLAGEAWLHNEIGLFYERLFLESNDARYLESAYAAFDEGAKIGSLDPDILYNMTEVEFRRQRLAEKPDYARVAQLIERIYQIEPDYAPARILEGRLLYRQDKFEEAEFRYQSVSTQIGNDPMALLALAEAYIDLGRDKDAAKVVARARALQPWNRRVQALGKVIEENAAAIAAAAAAATVTPASLETVVEDDGAAEIVAPAPAASPEQPQPSRPAAPRASVVVPGDEAWEYVQSEEPAPASEEPAPAPEILKSEAKASVLAPGDPQWESGVPESAAPRPESAPAAKDADGRRTRIKRHRLADAAAPSDAYPQEIQASVNPASVNESGRVRYPMTEVRLPEDIVPGNRQATDAPAANDPAPAAPETDIDAWALDLGFTPGRPDKLEAVVAPEPDAFPDDFGDDYHWEDAATVGNGDYPFYGMIERAANAYASLPLPDFDLPGPAEADAAHIPPAFSFAPDDSPVILASVKSPGDNGRPAPARNANLYRAFPRSRQMAEIIERDPVTPRPGLNGTPAMIPPAGGVIRRAEVRLPSSSRGVGLRDARAERGE